MLKNLKRGVKTVVVAFGLAVAVCGVRAIADDLAVLRGHHPWGRFAPGSWKLVRIVTKTLDSQGQVATTSTAETRTTLAEAKPEGFTLSIEATVEVSGKKVETDPRKVTQGYRGEESEQQAVVKDLGRESLKIEGRNFECRLEQIEIVSEDARTLVKTWYSDSVAPYVLRRESVTTNPKTGQLLSEATVEIVKLVQPRKVLGTEKPTTELSIKYKHATGQTTTRAWSTLDVPGAIVAHVSEEFDAQGVLLRTSTLELADYVAK